LSEFLANFGHWTSLQQFASARKGPAMLLRLDVRSGSKADMAACPIDVRFTPKSGHAERIWDVRYVPEADSCTAANDTAVIAENCEFSPAVGLG